MKSTKKILKIILVASFATGIAGLLIWYIANQPKTPESDIISQSGIHWHPEITILINGQKQKIPANIGIGIVEKPVHTHDDMGVIHLEFSGLVKKEDVKLGKFFEIWGKDMRSFGTNMKMNINGKENFDFENYIMRDGDKIEIIFE